MSLIPKLYHATAGKITIDGIDLREWNTGRLRERIGFVPQKSLLFSGTILDNIRWGNPQASLSEVRQAAETAQIDSFIVGLPAGYDSAVGQRGVNLSGGQKQRLAVARALVKSRRSVLDDCTSALDAITEAPIRRALSEQMQGTTCIIISQRVTSMMGADRILVLDEGRVVGLGTHAELMQHCPVYQDIYHLQVGRKGAV